MNWQRVLISHTIKITLILSLILSYSSIFSQPEGDGKISGYVFNASHQPLVGVEVRAFAYNGTYFHRISYSAEDGGFVIDDLPVGQYYVRVQNKLGYLNVFYDNVIDKSDATPIKINASQHIKDINFYLERGGFISGHIYDADGNKLTTNTSIGFFDAENFGSHGFINSNADGSYISPALPNRPHIVKASALPSGYVMTYFDNVSTQDSAQAIYIAPSDSVKNIDFYLQKGGAISGYVFGAKPDYIPIPDVWIVVTEWENGEWRSESVTNSTGYYCAAGLRPGAYRVYVYGLDPLKYHNKYYQDSPQYENASKVIVVNQDTTQQINFSLKPVKRLVLSNDYIEFAVSDRYPGTNLSLGITGGLPETSFDDNKPILFGHPYPYTSFTTIWIDGKELIFGSSDGDLIDDPYISRDRKSIGRRWDYQKIEVKQKITLLKSEWSETKYEDTAQIQYVIANNDNMPHEIGVRILFDTMLGKDDAALIRTSTFPYTGLEQDFYAPDIPAWWTAIEGERNKTIFSVQGTLKDYGATLPDRFSIVNWSNIFKTKWKYKTNSDLEVINDSGVALWWNPVIVEPGIVRIICTYVGLGEMYPDKKPPYTKNHIPAKDSSYVSRNTNIQLDILDDYMGVDTTTIVMKVNDEIVIPRISGRFQHYRLFYDPPDDFLYNDTVRVIVEAADLAIIPNVMEPDTYQFYISKDILPPYVQNLYPEPKAHAVPPDTCLSFILGDKHSGVNKDSIQIFVNRIPITPQLDGNPQEISVRYPFYPPFGEMDSVSVRITATDRVNPPNVIDTTFYFFVARDSIAPWVKSYYPSDQATEVDLDTAIFMTLVDDFTGVDFSFIQLKLNNLSVVPEIKGDSSCYIINYRPNNGFRYNEQMIIILEGQDLAKIPNIMKPFAFSFTTKTDTIPPSVALVTPSPGDTNVNPTPLIVLEIKDEKAGIDSTSIMLRINGESVNYTMTGNEHHYGVSYQCETPFDYLEWVSVAVVAQDKSNPPNASDTTVYRFRIMREKDLSPPYTTLHQPPKGSTDVAPDCSISFHIKDDLSGVDSSSIRLKVNGTEVNRKISGNVYDYKVEYKPVDPFKYGQQVLFEIDAEDLAKDAPNVMKTDSCFFKIMFDTSPPEIVWIKPAQPGDHIPLNSEFIAEITDSLTGVDVNSLKFKFRGDIIQPQIYGNQNRYQIRYQPAERLKYNQQIRFMITGSDLATPPNWIQDSLFIFYTIEDHDPPYITLRIPDKNEVDVPFDTEIVICIKDDIAGVDRDSIRMTVAGTAIMPNLSGSTNEIKLSYIDPKGYRPGQKIEVTLEAADLSNPPNQMDSDSYSFFIQQVYPDLFINSFTVNPAKILVHKPMQFNATIEVITAPVFDPIQIKLWDNNIVLLDTMFQSMDVDDSIDLTRVLIFNRKGKHQLNLSIDPENKIMESNEANNTAIKVIEVLEGELTVRSNPFTPNGDGINDEVTFNFEKLGVINPLLKLFDVSGRAIATITDRTGYKFVWNGKDRFGNPAQPGVYLYLIQDQDKTIANGYVVLAR
ncbi:MAG: carboxypeptidase regulatory-like domain-containing protein [bacterium]|nr:MAG: carboxypeptidase regulatory-like domain-containing protein [bacterium]